MKGWKKAVVCGLAQVSLLAAGCSGVEAEPEQPVAPAVQQPTGSMGGLLVSPQLFELTSRWAADAGGVKAASAGAAPSVDLPSYIRQHAPELSAETASVLARLHGGSAGNPTAQGDCRCQVMATFDQPSTYLSGGGWSMNVAGAAHSGSIYDSKSGGTTEAVSHTAVYKSQFKSRMVCVSPTGQTCSAGCTAKLYVDVQYSTQVNTAADTGGIWSKGAQAQITDGATLHLRKPYNTNDQLLFEKAAAISHYASSSTFDPQALADVLKGALAIGTAIVKEDSSGISDDLIDRTVKGLFGLRHHSGNNGSTAQGLIADFESPFWAPIEVSYSSVDHQYYGLDLASNVRMRVRGYGGWHRGQGTVASSYGIAAYVDNFVCDASVTNPPTRSAFWNYNGYEGAAVPVSSVKDRIGNFFYLGFGVRPDLSQNTGTINQGVCGDGICGGLESDSSCAVDCVRCGDNKCSLGESVTSCPGDCGYCGDAYCSSIEDVGSCLYDCGSCGDGFCGANEDTYSCSTDCGYCGDGMCSYTEDYWSCSWDCGYCGDGVCSGNEDYWSCQQDCY